MTQVVRDRRMMVVTWRETYFLGITRVSFEFRGIIQGTVEKGLIADE